MGEVPESPTNSLAVRQLRTFAVQALAEQRLEDAVIALRQAVEMDPCLEWAWNDLGVVMEALGNPREAMRCYRQALRVQPSHREAFSNLGLLTLQMDFAQALRHQALTAVAGR